MKFDDAIRLVQLSYEVAQSQYGRLASPHEGYAVILEELDELKAEVWKKRPNRNFGAMRTEAAHVAAMALRFIVELT